MWKIFIGIIEYLPLWLFIKFIGLYRYKPRIKIGSSVIAFAIRYIPKFRNRVLKNLRLIFPDLSNIEKSNFLKEFSQNLGTTFTEFLFNDDFHNKQKINLKDPGKLDPIRSAVKNNQPVIIVSGHFGPWEAVRAVLRKNGLEAGAVYRKSRNIFYQPYHHKTISAGGTPIFQTGRKGTGEMVRYLKTGGIICLMIDQSVSDGHYLDFLGKPAKTSISIANIALKYDATIIPAYGIRRKDNKIEVSFEKPIKLKNPLAITGAMNASLEARVQETPEQWYWPHRRWK